MTLTFESTAEPDFKLLEAIVELNPKSPFNHPAYADAMRALGVTPCALALLNRGVILGGCCGYLTGSRWHRRLQIPTTPALENAEVFWDGVAKFCDTNKVSELVADTFASEQPSMPKLGRKQHHRKRSEFLIDLASTVVDENLSKNHKRNVKRALAAGFKVAATRQPQDCAKHVALMHSSMARRNQRGEKLSISSDQGPYRAFIDSGIGELFQVTTQADEVMASIMVLRTPTSAYYQTAGTLPEGMKNGASPFLVTEVAKSLHADGVRWFNLGGADPAADGLRRFKSGFGAQIIDLEAISCELVSTYRKTTRRLASRVGRILARHSRR